MHRASGQTTYTIYPVSGYTFGLKSPKIEKDHSVLDRLNRMKAKYEKEGQRRSVEAVLLVWEHAHPHVLLLQVGSAFFKLPGGRLRPGEEEIEGLQRKLSNSLSPVPPNPGPVWEIGECLGVYWRPNFETIFYPYLPPHVTKPKECKKIFVVPLPEKCNFAIPKNLKLLAVPLFELYDNVARYGPVISAIPQVVSRLRLNTVALPPRTLSNASALKHQHSAVKAERDSLDREQRDSLGGSGRSSLDNKDAAAGGGASKAQEPGGVAQPPPRRRLAARLVAPVVQALGAVVAVWW